MSNILKILTEMYTIKDGNNPEPLSITDANRHILQSAMIQYVSIIMIVILITAIVFNNFLNSYLHIAIGMFFTYMLLSCIYIIRHWIFVFRNRRYGTLCPECCNRIWQFSCICCKQPVPSIFYLFNGILFNKCPFCGTRLSCRKLTLLAYCHHKNCDYMSKHPEILYEKPTHIIVWIVESIEDWEKSIIQQNGINDKWKFVDKWRFDQKKDRQGKIYYYNESKTKKDRHSASFLFVIEAKDVIDKDINEIPFNQVKKNQTRLIIVSKNINIQYRNQIKNLIHGDGEFKLTSEQTKEVFENQPLL